MIKSLLKTLFAGGLALLLVTPVMAEQASFPQWTDFYGTASTFNGEPIPAGSIVEAFDSEGTFCGSDTVSHSGHYGFLPAMNDDTDTPEDEGAVLGERINFKINGRLADDIGPDEPIWVGYGLLNVDLTAVAMVSIAEYQMPADQYAHPGETIRYFITVQNTGEAMDFYSVSVTSENSWIVNPQIDLVYADPMGEATVYFDVLVPPGIQDGTDRVDYSVISGLDPAVMVTGYATTYVSTTATPDDDDPLIPNGFNLHQNYPNPFNPATTISFDLPTASEVRVDVYDLLGRRVESMELGDKSAGTYYIEFDGSNLASGIYFYQIKAGAFTDSKKMILMK